MISHGALAGRKRRTSGRGIKSCFDFAVKRCLMLLKAVVLLLHALIVGVLFLFDHQLWRTARIHPWYIAAYLLLFLLTLVQYFFISHSSPGYVIDAMGTRTSAVSSLSSIMYIARRQSCSGDQLLDSSSSLSHCSIWLKQVMDLYPPGFASRGWTCSYCYAIQPPRSKHCHDCDKCVLRFDHHCAWLGNCIGQRNHCQFWWYIFGETVLCIWTSILYIAFLRSNDEKSWWVAVIVIVMLVLLVCALIFVILLLLFHSYLAITNQTTYELMRRRRLLYLRGLPNNVHPFSKGIRRNLYEFCCLFGNTYKLEAVPTMEEWEAMARPYTCIDVISGRCC